MVTQLRQTIEKLKSRVQKNLNVFYENERIVKKLLEEPESEERNQKLEEKYYENKQLLKENDDSIKLQLQLTKFIDTYEKELEKTEEEQFYNPEAAKETNESLTKEEIFELTKTKDLQFDENHPYFDDEEFFDELMDYFSSIEDYEMCSALMENRKKLSES
jgi:hypothetical protein